MCFNWLPLKVSILYFSIVTILFVSSHRNSNNSFVTKESIRYGSWFMFSLLTFNLDEFYFWINVLVVLPSYLHVQRSGIDRGVVKLLVGVYFYRSVLEVLYWVCHVVTLSRESISQESTPFSLSFQSQVETKLGSVFRSFHSHLTHKLKVNTCDRGPDDRWLGP